MRYTIKDVAKKADVSIATVSRVLNNKDRVNDETKEKILSVIEKMNYTVNFSAKRLRINKTNLIGVIVPDISVSFYSEIIKGIENKANEFDYRLIVCDAQNSIGKEKKYLKLLYDGSLDGMVFVVPKLHDEDLMEIKKGRYPITVFGKNMENNDIPSITVDNGVGAYNAVRHLCSHGYSKVAYIGGIEAENDYDHKARLAAYKKALSDCQYEILNEYIEKGQYFEEGGSMAFMRLMRLKNPPDAIFCANDEMALGVLKAAKKLNINIPGQVGLIGFDNIRICQYTNPTLTTVNQPTYNIGVLLCERLINSIENKDAKIKNANLLLKPELIIRESCGC